MPSEQHANPHPSMPGGLESPPPRRWRIYDDEEARQWRDKRPSWAPPVTPRRRPSPTRHAPILN